jgi:formylglycine-generating enzyme required for sulfatase activity
VVSTEISSERRTRERLSGELGTATGEVARLQKELDDEGSRSQAVKGENAQLVQRLNGELGTAKGEVARLQKELTEANARLSRTTPGQTSGPAPAQSASTAPRLGTDPGLGNRQVSGKIGDVFRTDIGMELVWIPAGTFQMGSPEGVGYGDERPQTEVTISRPFWMGRFEVRQRDWQAVMGNNPSYSKGEDLPVELVDWNQCVEFGKKLTERMKGKIPEGYEFRLPTEAEREYACRARTTTSWSFGDEESAVKPYAWYDNNAGGKTQPVGQKLANPWGLYDMHGGVWEWVLDWNGTYPGGRVTDPKGPANGSHRVIRGGAWSFSVRHCRSAYRGFGDQGNRWLNLGFRLVLAPRSAP